MFEPASTVFSSKCSVRVAQVAAALAWGLSLQKVLLTVKWPTLLDTVEATALCKQDGRIIRRGVRAKIGVYADKPDYLQLHSGSGRADYFGTFVNRSSRMLSCASSGQIIGLQEHVAEALELWKSQNSNGQEGMYVGPNPPSHAGSMTEQGTSPRPACMVHQISNVGWHTRMSVGFKPSFGSDKESSAGGTPSAKRASFQALWTRSRMSSSGRPSSGLGHAHDQIQKLQQLFRKTAGSPSWVACNSHFCQHTQEHSLHANLVCKHRISCTKGSSTARVQAHALKLHLNLSRRQHCILLHQAVTSMLCQLAAVSRLSTIARLKCLRRIHQLIASLQCIEIVLCSMNWQFRHWKLLQSRNRTTCVVPMAPPVA